MNSCFWKISEQEQLLEAMADVDALIVRSDKVDAEVINTAGNLKIVVSRCRL